MRPIYARQKAEKQGPEPPTSRLSREGPVVSEINPDLIPRWEVLHRDRLFGVRRPLVQEMMGP